MERLRRSRHVSLFAKGEDVFAYHDLVGDIVRMDAKLVAFLDFFEEPRTQAEARARFANDFGREDLDAFFEILPAHRLLVREGLDEKLAVDWLHPFRGPWLLRHEDTLGYVERSSDRVTLEKLGAHEERVLRLCDGTRTIAEIAAEAGESARATIFRWTHSERQVLKLLEKQVDSYERLPHYVESTMPFARFEKAVPPTDSASTRDYHAHDIESADEQFDVRETTLSHALREPHPALGGETYAARLLRALEERDLLGASTKTIVEVGGGVGWFARGALAALHGRTLSWTICDLAPELQRSQREKVTDARARFVRGDAERLPLRSGSVDLLVANEMIADLETVRVERGSEAAAALASRHGISFADAREERFWVNAGALRLVREVARVLAPDGAAVLTEFGELDRYPVESTHLDHREFSIHFGHLRDAALHAGLDARVEVVPDLIELQPGVRVLATNRSFFRILRALLDAKGVRLEKLAYTREQLERLVAGKLDLDALEGLKLLPAGERLLGLRPREFKALLIRKRAPRARRALDV